jgi:hypothetical protein
MECAGFIAKTFLPSTLIYTRAVVSPRLTQRDTDSIDFSKAASATVTRKLMSESAYLPKDADGAPWMADVAAEDTAALLTKVSAADACVLEKLAQAPRLGSIVKIAYKRRRQRRGVSAQASAVERIPEGDSPLEWEPYVMLAYGIKLGGSRALATSGLPIYKGQNIFPSGVLGEPVGYWDPERSQVDSLRLYAYRHLFDHSKLYAIRNVSQLPCACSAPEDMVFQNTAQLVQLVEDFPLNLYLLSRVPQWFAVKVLRTSIVEDLFTTWFKRNLLLIPIPPSRNPSDIARLKSAGELVVTKDKDLANAHRHVEQLIANSPKKTLFDLFAENNPLVADADLTGTASGDVTTSIHEEGEDLVSDDGSFRIKLPNSLLRRYLAYRLDRLLDEDEDLAFDIDTLGSLQVPSDLEAVVAAIDVMRNADPARLFQDALLELDIVVADLFNMSRQDLDYITSAMANDGFLKQLRPNYEHRGLRVQPYADHSQEDRYS